MRELPVDFELKMAIRTMTGKPVTFQHKRDVTRFPLRHETGVLCPQKRLPFLDSWTSKTGNCQPVKEFKIPRAKPVINFCNLSFAFVDPPMG